jgi:tRNA threonylcarbamoyladenosine biosynthesis protein TsaB
MTSTPTAERRALTLVLDASSYEASVAVLRNGSPAASRRVAMRGAHEERLMPAVAAVLDDAGVTVGDLEQVICGDGPGSFTSLRIAASIAKGLAAGRAIPLFSASSLLLMLASLPVGSGRYLAISDAMRGDLYAEGYELTTVLDLENPDRGEGYRVRSILEPRLVKASESDALAGRLQARVVGGDDRSRAGDRALGAARLLGSADAIRRASLSDWEPSYGRLAEAQVKWEAAHGRRLASDADRAGGSYVT